MTTAKKQLASWCYTAAARWNQHPRLQRLALALLLVLLVLVFLRHLLPHPTYIGSFGDIRSFHFWWAVSRKEVLEFGQLPFWNPYYCGGMVHWANVQTMFLSPTFVLNLLFGPGVGLRSHIVLYFVAGFVGCWVLARHRGISGLFALAPGVVFVFGGNLAERATGHLGFMPFLLLPWLAYFYERTRGELRWAIPCGLLIASCVFAGAPYPFVFFCLYVAVRAACDLVAGLWTLWQRQGGSPSVADQKPPPTWRSLSRPVLVGAIVASAALAVAAIKLLPIVDFMSEYPRHHGETDSLAAWQVWEVFLEPDLVRHRKGYLYVFGEYRNYLGPLAMLALPVMLLSWRRLSRDYALIFIFGALMIGDAAAWAPYRLLSQLPIFSSLRVPVRYAIIVDLHIALLFGHMLASGAGLAAGIGQRRWRLAAHLLLAGVLVSCAFILMTTNNRQHQGLFNTSDQAPPRPGPFRMIRGRPHDVVFAPHRNEGHIRCYEANPLQMSRHLKAQPASEVELDPGPGPAEVTLVKWTPNRLLIQADLAAPRTVVVNMNYHRDWHASVGRVVRRRGLLAVEVPAGQHTLELWYRPRRLGPYLAITLLGMIGCVVAWRGKALRR